MTIHTNMESSPPRSENLNETVAVRWWRRAWLRLALCFVFVTTIPLVATAVYTTRRHLAVVRSAAARAALERAESAAQSAVELLDSAGRDLLAVSEWPLIEAIPEGDRDGATPNARAYWPGKLAVQLRTFAELKPVFSALACIGADGRTLVNIRRSGTSTRVYIDPDAGLGSAAASQPETRPFWKPLVCRAATLPPRQLAFAWQPRDGDLILAFAVRASVRRIEPRPVVIAELSWQHVASIIASASANAGEQDVALYDAHWDPLIPPGAPRLPLDRVAAGAAQCLLSDGRCASIVPIRPGPGSESPAWNLVMFESSGALEVGAADFRAAFLLVLGGSLALAVMIAIFISRQFTRPVKVLHDASRRIGRGDFNIRVSNEAGDEFGLLAAQIGRMATQLRTSHDDFEERLKEKTEQLLHAERLSTIGRTAAAVAHEINNPSGIISFYAQMILERLPSDAAFADKLRVIDAKAREISTIVQELLDYSRKPEPCREWFGLREAVDEAMDSVRAGRAANHEPADVGFEVRVEGRAARLFADRGQFIRVMRNLITNGVHAMPQGGVMSVHAREGEAGAVLMEVIDTGEGIEPEMLAHLFDPFFTTKRFGTGTGLGLAISREIIERHDGAIQIESKKGGGTKIKITWPQSPEGTL